MEESLNKIGIQHAVVDIAITADAEERPLVIELNPWGMRAGPALFDWNEDAEVLLGIN